MAIVELTDAFVRNLDAPKDKRFEVSDKVRPGLRLRVNPSGRMKWMYEKRVKNGEKRKHDLGTYPHVSIKEARRQALEIQVESERGFDRVNAERERRKQEERDRQNFVPLREVLELYHEVHASSLSTGKTVMLGLWDALEPYLDSPSIDMTQASLQAAIDAKAKTGAKVQANRLRAYLTHFSKFARVRGRFAHGVGTELQKVVKENPRERELSLDEVRTIYYASFAMGDLWGPIIRLMIFTLQREDEIAALRWGEVNFRAELLFLKGSRTKNSNAHLTHLSAPALEELVWLKAWADEDADLVFTTTGKTPPSGFGKMKKRLDEFLGDKVEPYTLHDLRTAFATIMCSEGATESVVDRVLNHSAVASAPSPVARVYNRAVLIPQRRVVLDWWGELVTGERELVYDVDGEEADNVVRIA